MGRHRNLTRAERLLRKVAHKRFSKLLHFRVARRMKPVLGEPKWAEFVRDALQFGKPLYMSAFKPGNVWCRGPVDGDTCMGSATPDGSGAYGRIHGDHTTDLNNICTAWCGAQMPGGRHWHSGLRADLVMSAIFEFSESHLVFRCEACHSHLPHYAMAISKADLALSGTPANPIVIAD